MSGLIPYSALSAYEWLDTPMWCFDLDQRKMCWANAAGVSAWNASSLQELQQRDYSDISETTETRLKADMTTHANGQTTREQWTLYPKGKPMTITAHGFGVLLPDGRTGILYEGIPVPDAYEPSVLRGIEAIQYTSVRIGLYDLQGCCLMRNPAAVSAFGLNGQGGQADAFEQLFAQTGIARAVMQTVQDGQDFSAEVELRTLRGVVWHGLDARQVTDPVSGQPAILINARDISDLKQVENELRLAKEAAETASQAKSRFLATMSHEIRTPMNGVLGMAQLLLDDTASADERKDYARVILNSGQTLLTLLNEILDLSKVEAGKLELEDAPFDIQTLLEDTSRIFRESIKKKALQYDCNWTGQASARYRGDANRIRQMLSNLVGNAVKFTEQGFIRVTVAEIESDERTSVLEFSVADGGIGLSDSQARMLFKPFTQGDSSTTRKYGGTGLGLSIVKSLSELMHGSVGVSSTFGQGARFWFRIRVGRVLEGENMLSGVQPASRADNGATLQAAIRVLLVDDNLINRTVIEAMLRKYGMEIQSVENGQEAVARIQSGTLPDIILMDCQMPVMDGFEATREIRRWELDAGDGHLPIVALTADAFEEDRERCLQSGMDDYLAKPVKIQDLMATIRNWCPDRG